MSIYIITHKPFNSFTNLQEYKTLLVGADKNSGLPEYLCDNDFQGNISSKNANFCELTGAYWILNQCSDEIVGLVHYRRFFKNDCNQAIGMYEIEQYLLERDIILPKREKSTFLGLPCGSKRHFINIHGSEGKEAWEVMGKVLKEKYPEMTDAFRKYEKQTSGYFYNMCIMKKSDFDRYYEWLFDILFQVEKEINVNSYSKYNQRMFGFLSERLLTFWVTFHALQIKEIEINFTEKPSFLESVKQFVYRKMER
ncbi:TPA: DUF4422 domain-containing protein [Streptococcus suis]|uniref:DUF4422 domain-containing protein n=3 Tax=Streptococcus suis TaxID=1307 RepID=A0A0Z8FT91_STRSU|nr:DUF4422 domain-containing protein [Streptococcus suis]HEM3195387.1 DUF4422 domain-containing protein [Streptococcus suis 10581]NJW41045.1 DUF4422 domain-containing protein [Streptococcus suis]NQG45757.1 DUF4422 domain-containing protein [Streptococcus suis]NQH00125.1 DUF4422 domain-containing protein [Streptococcus suis]NQH16072.1 DUF4422 domain-containing protein [Streptococcus suis]